MIYLISGFGLVLVAAIAFVFFTFRSIDRELREWFNPGDGFGLHIQFYKNRKKSRASIPVVAVEPQGGYKYVVIEYNGKIYIRAQANKQFHAHIVGAFVFEIGDANVTCLGGGEIKADTKNGTVSLSGYSRGYGEDQDRARSYALIEEHLKLKRT